VTAPTPSEISTIIINASEDLYQDDDVDVKNIVLDFDNNIVTLEPQAEYQVSALILSRKNYYFEFGAKVMPTNLALGWGDMADENQNQRIKSPKVADGITSNKMRQQSQTPNILLLTLPIIIYFLPQKILKKLLVEQKRDSWSCCLDTW